MKVVTHTEPSDEEDATDLTIAVLGFLATDEARLSRFFALTGLSPDTLRRSATNPRFFADLLDYLAMDEALFVAFAESQGRHPEQIAQLRRRLAPPLD